MRPGRSPWRSRAYAVVALVAAVLVALIVIFQNVGLDQADKLASVLAVLVAVLAASTPVVVWMIRRSRAPADEKTLDRLRAAVHDQWSAELSSRRLFLPRPLRLGLHPSTRPGVVAGDLDPALRPPADASLIDVMRLPGLRQLVLLGEPGGGKTTVALHYVVAATAGDADGPVPVPVTAASWDPTLSELTDWIVERMVQNHPVVTVAEAAALVRGREIIAVADGLDEMPAALRAEAFTQLELAAAAGLVTLITCRGAEYEAMTAEAGVLPQALVLELDPVDPQDAVRYLNEREAAGSTRWDAVTEALTESPDSPVARALSTPLMVAFARAAYRSPGSAPTALVDARDPGETLLDGFLTSIYGDGTERARRRLAFLIRTLADHARDPDLAWWHLPRGVSRLTLLALVTVLVTALGTGGVGLILSVLGLAVTPFAIGAAATGGLAVGLTAGLATIRASRAGPRAAARRSWPRALLTGPVDLVVAVGLLSVTVAAVLLVARWTGWFPPVAMTTVITLADWVAAPVAGGRELTGAAAWLIAGLLTLVIFTGGASAGRGYGPRRAVSIAPRRFLASLFNSALALSPLAIISLMGWVPEGVVLGILIVLVVVVLVGLGRSLAVPIDLAVHEVTPAAGLAADRRVLLLATSMTALALGGPVTWSLLGADAGPTGSAATGLIVALFTGLLVFFGSGSAWAGYSLARLWLALRGRIPLRLMTFLDHAHRAGVLRQAGIYHQLRHDLIRAHLLGGKPPPERAETTSRMPGRVGLALVAVVAVLAAPAAAVAIDPRPVPRAVASVRGQILRTYPSHDGRTVILLGEDGSLTAWQVTDGSMTSLYAVTPGHLPALEYDWDRRVVVQNDIDGVVIWTGTGGVRSYTLEPWAVALTPEGLLAVGDAEAGEVRLVDPATGRVIRAYDARDDRARPVMDVALDRTGTRAAVLDAGGTLRVIELRTGRVVTEVDAGAADSCGFVGDGLIATTGPHAVRLWHPDGRPAGTVGGVDRDERPGIMVSPDGATFLDPDDGGVSRLRRVADGARIGDLGGVEMLFSPEFSDDGALLAMQSAGGGATVLNTRTGRETDPPIRATGLSGIVLSPRPGRVAVTDGDGLVWLHDTRTGRRYGPVDQAAPGGVAFSGDGRTLVTVGGAGTVRAWAVPDF